MRFPVEKRPHEKDLEQVIAEAEAGAGTFASKPARESAVAFAIFQRLDPTMTREDFDRYSDRTVDEIDRGAERIRPAPAPPNERGGSDDDFQPALCLYLETAFRAEAAKQGRLPEYERQFGQAHAR